MHRTSDRSQTHDAPRTELSHRGLGHRGAVGAGDRSPVDELMVIAEALRVHYSDLLPEQTPLPDADVLRGIARRLQDIADRLS